MLLPSQWEIVGPQRAITVDFLNRRRLKAPAIWLKPESEFPAPADAVAASLDTVLDQWALPDDERNLAVRLIDGIVQITIKASDEKFTSCLFESLLHLGVDARAAFALNGGPPIGLILKIDNPETIDKWRLVWPAGWKSKTGGWTEISPVYSSLPTAKAAKPVWRNSSPLPGSIFLGSPVVWRPGGKAATPDIDALEARDLAASPMSAVVRANAYATLLYWLRERLDGATDWDPSMTKIIGGWLAREVLMGQAINERGKSLDGSCWAPVDTREQAEALIAFLQKKAYAGGGLKVAFEHAETQLQRDNDSKIPSWRSVGEYLGSLAKIAMQRAFHSGIDITLVERFSEQYIYNREEDVFLDRGALVSGLRFAYSFEALHRRHANEVEYVGKKPKNPFDLYAMSGLRTDADRADMTPGKEPGAILRHSKLHGLLANDADGHADEIRIFNTYRGLAVPPPSSDDKAELTKVEKRIDQLLGYLTQDNPHQIKWVKQWIAWTVQHPEQKQQTALVLIGGQGIGKSILGSEIMRALFGEMAGKISAQSLENQFAVTGFLGNLVTLVDEARLQSINSINEIKQVVREYLIPGQTKGEDHKVHHVWSRVIIAANQAKIGLTAEDAADRALRFVVGYTAKNKQMSDPEFKTWARSLQPFFDELLADLKTVKFRQHLMRYFLDFETTWVEIHDLTHSSSDDEDVVVATMSDACKMARDIAANCTIRQALDITAWFNASDLSKAIKAMDLRSRVDGDQVLREYERLGVLEKMRPGMYRLKFKYGSLLRALSTATNLELDPWHDLKPDDYGDNPVQSYVTTPPWRGWKTKIDQRSPHADEEGPIP